MMEPRAQPGPGSEAFAPEKHRWFRHQWWTADGQRWWDGSRWQSRESHPGPPGPIGHRKRRPIARVVSGVMHASVLGLFALPFVSFEADCRGALDTSVTGYQAMVGFNLPQVPFPPFQPESPFVSFRSYEPNLLLWLVLLAAVAGVAAAVTGGPRATGVRLLTAATAAIATWAAIEVVYPAFDYQGTSVYVDPGGAPLGITGALIIAILADLLSLALYGVRRSSSVQPALPAVTEPRAPTSPPAAGPPEIKP